MVKYTNLKDFADALVSATDENEDGNAMGIVVPDFGDDVVDLFITPGASFDAFIATKGSEGDVHLLKNYAPYFGYWFNDGKVPADFYEDFEPVSIELYLKQHEILACYLLDADDIDQVLFCQENEVHNPFFRRNNDFGTSD